MLRFRIRDHMKLRDLSARKRQVDHHHQAAERRNHDAHRSIHEPGPRTLSATRVQLGHRPAPRSSRGPAATVRRTT
jgi:hypothetical protein